MAEISASELLEQFLSSNVQNLPSEVKYLLSGKNGKTMNLKVWIRQSLFDCFTGLIDLESILHPT